MEDSQLSDLIRQGKVCDSQELSRDATQELSQNTLQRIIEWNESPLMTQNSEDFLNKSIDKIPAIRAAYHDILRTEKSKETKKRTPRINDELPSISTLKQRESELNMSRDVFDDSLNFSVMNESTHSFQCETLTQIQLESQKIVVLRKRTTEEQEERQKKKSMEAKSSESVKKELDLDQQAKDRMSEGMTQRADMDFDMDGGDDSIPRNVIKIEEEAKSIIEEPSMDISVIPEKAMKLSDFAYRIFGDKKILWTKSKCIVPIMVTWKPSYTDKKLYLRIRFVSFNAHFVKIGKAIRSPITDVLKCSRHTIEETRIPLQSFFYITTRPPTNGLPWACNQKNLHYKTELPMGTTEVNFDITFSCQNNCLPLEEKRKTMCLAAILEDEKGNEIQHSAIEEVHICGYPQRDYKNYVARFESEFHFPELSSFKSSSVTPTIDRSRAPSTSAATYDMLSAYRSNQMFPSTSNPRKRGASELIQIKEAFRPSPKPVTYAQRFHGIGAERMDYEVDFNENRNNPKKSRPILFPTKTIQLSEAEYTKVVRFLATDAEETQKERNSTIKYPQVVTPSFKPTDGVERFLTSVGLSFQIDLVKRLNIYSMNDLTKKFKTDFGFFEKIASDSETLEKCYKVFLTYYRIQEDQELPEENPI